MIRKLFANTAIYSLASQVSKVAGIFALPIVTPHLTKTDFGVWGVLLAYTGLIKAFSFLGLYVVLSNSFFKSPMQYKWLWKQVYGFLILWMPIFAIINGTLIYFILPTEAESHRWILIALLTLPLVFFGPVAKIGELKYQFEQKPMAIGIRATIFGLLAIGLNIYTIAYLKLGFMGWAWSSFIVTMLVNISYWIPVNLKFGLTPIFNFKRKTIWSALKIGFPTIPHKYASYLLNSSDRVVMERLNVSTDNIGIYNVAGSFGGYFNNLAIAGERALNPMLFQAYKSGDLTSAKNLIKISAVAMLSLTFLYSIWSKEIFTLLIRNEGLVEAYRLSIILVMAYAYRPYYTTFVSSIVYNEKTKYLWRISLIAGFLNVALNLIFIPVYGFQAAAYTTFISFMVLGFYGFVHPKIKSEIRVKSNPITGVLSIISATIVAYYMVEFDLSIKIVVTIFIICVIAILGYNKLIKLNRDGL